MAFDIFLTVFLVFLNGFFVAAEFAIVKVRSSQLDIKVREGKRAAKLSRNIVNHLDAYLSATQLGITLASLGLGWIGESVVSAIIINIFEAFNLNLSPEVAHQAALPVAFSLITVLHIVFGELAPKSMAIRAPVQTTLAVAYPMRLFYLLFKPFIWVLNGFANFILKMMGISPLKGSEVHSAEELYLLIDQGKETGAIKSSEHEIITNAFDFADRYAKKIMIPRTQVTAVDIESTNKEVIDIIINEGFSRLPVYKDSLDHITGVVHAKDIIPHIRDNQQVFEWKELIRPAFFIHENKRIGELLKELQVRRVHMAVVLDEFGGTSGIITLEDIIEEIVGEIQDEYDEEAVPVQKINEKEFIINAVAMISDVNEYLPEPLPEDEYETVNGFVSHLFGKIPEVDEIVTFEKYTIKILKKSKNMINQISLKIE